MHAGSAASAAFPTATAPHTSVAQARVSRPATGSALTASPYPPDRSNLPDVRHSEAAG